MSVVCEDPRVLRAGLDVGSTTVKLVVTDEAGERVLFRRYRRHYAHLVETAASMLAEAEEEIGEASVILSVCGSGGRPLADALGVEYVQEVVANAVAVSRRYPQARCAIELGGQDAKVVFFREDEHTGRLVVSDMRMNGSCAGGTGAFVDEIAKLLDAEEEGLEPLAARGSRIYEVSGRCGVFAKTDIQPLRIAGASREDLALSAFHAIAKQTIGGLAQGLALTPPIVFEGGPLTYHPTLVRVFAERLGLAPGEVIVPEHPETMVALGTALAGKNAPSSTSVVMSFGDAVAKLDAFAATGASLEKSESARPFFANVEEQAAFEARHEKSCVEMADLGEGPVARVYLGVDSGSTTSKVVLLTETGEVADTFYASNEGDPIRTVRRGILELRDRAQRQGKRLDVLGIGTTGYGEKMMAAALGADVSAVETVAHARGCTKYVPEATFVLDIGGQDMKAIWLDNGVVTDVVLNEACSSGCGSFLENFASSLGMACEDIAKEAFASESPAKLGSRCTVFMTSTVITEQRAGKRPRDIMAGLCRSVVENVFTKVVRISDPEELGETVVVQGGAFRNDAVLRAIEEHLGRNVIRAPFPGEMGAIGAALLARDEMIARLGAARSAGECASDVDGNAAERQDTPPSRFIGFEALCDLDFVQEAGATCEKCANACQRTITRFSTGAAFTVGNKCPRGEAAGAGAPGHVGRRRRGIDLCALREQMLFEIYPIEPVRRFQHEVVGIPRVLEFWDSMPFWSTFFRALGYHVCFSHASSAALLESGLPYVASDTVCLPAKIAHGHVLNLCQRDVDRIFFPYVMHKPPEGRDKTSPYMCAIVMGYPLVVRNFQDPESTGNVVFDTPVFHWFSDKDRVRQIADWAHEALGATASEAREAFRQGEAAQRSFREALMAKGAEVIEEAHRTGEPAVVLAGRPYHSDAFLSHGVSAKLADAGLSVLTPDCLPNLSDVSLENVLPEITNNFHTRMLESALIAATDPCLEYVQVVSFGCGHDAILTDEITRILTEVGGKRPLVLKMDETDAAGSVDLRVRSFIATMKRRSSLAVSSARNEGGQSGKNATTVSVPALPNPYASVFEARDKDRRTLLIPNISAEVSLMLRGAMRSEGWHAEVLEVGGLEQIRTGKRYTHNDICFPCQMVIGEVVCALQSGAWDPSQVAVGMVKFKCDCRMSHYAALLRRALDAAGFAEVPILTTDPVDTKGMHPGVAMLGPRSVLKAVWAAMMLDILQDLKRRTRPYEVNAGETERVFSTGVANIAEALEQGLPTAVRAYREAVHALAAVPFDRSRPKPRVLVTGELLVTYHPGSNFHVEDYLVRHGTEPMFPRVTDQLRKDFIAAMAQITDFNAAISKESFPVTVLFNVAQSTMEHIAREHPLYEKGLRPDQMYEEVAHIIPKTLSCGEGWLMAAEIAHWAARGVRSFVILQPFGCLPNHICGRGVAKRLKDEYPGIQILPLDLDPDASFANVENRLQMLIMGDAAQKSHDGQE